ncbi:MAG: DNA-processing protein DprA [Gammaproteobacteria bacterium]
MFEAIRSVDAASIAPDLAWLNAPNRWLVCLDDMRYPPQLREIAAAPPLLFVEGDLQCLRQPQVAIVGSRNDSRSGTEFDFELAHELASRGIVVTSGLAHGIDAQAHRGCLAAGRSTVAVMGAGAENIYPRAHRELAAEIVSNGALVTEFSIDSDLRPENFPRRNRIISGLSLGVVVVEAAQASGSLITARLALEQGREVFAVPGSIRNPLVRGCHELIKQGAKLTESADDVLEEFPQSLLATCNNARDPKPDAEQTRSHPGELAAEQALTLRSMGYDPVSIDTLVRRTGLTASALSSILLELEINGRVAPHAGGMFTRMGAETD